jgi:hypothetical protein
MTALRRSLAGVAAGAAVAIAAVLIARGATHRPLSTRARPGAAPVAGSASVSAGGSARQRLTVADVQRGFVRSYAAYLDGAGQPSALRYASVTAREQARAGGRVPPAFRDGSLRVRDAQGEGTASSAQVTVTLENRSESYVITVQLLRTQFGWQVAQVQTPDLSIDDSARPVPGPPIPHAAQLASTHFALVYTAYREQARGRPPAAGMTATARDELAQRQDPLAGERRVSGSPRVVGLRYGPFQASEFAVTATVRTGGGQRRQFTVLMVNTPAGWECDAFL